MTEPKRHDTPHESLYAGMDNAALIAYCREVTRAMKANGYGGLVWDELVERFELALKSISVVSEIQASDGPTVVERMPDEVIDAINGLHGVYCFPDDLERFWERVTPSKDVDR